MKVILQNSSLIFQSKQIVPVGQYDGTYSEEKVFNAGATSTSISIFVENNITDLFEVGHKYGVRFKCTAEKGVNVPTISLNTYNASTIRKTVERDASGWFEGEIEILADTTGIRIYPAFEPTPLSENTKFVLSEMLIYKKS